MHHREIATTSTATVILSGWVYKTGRFSLLHSIKERYCVLSDLELKYYKHHDDQHPTTIIDLRSLTSVEEYNPPHQQQYHHKDLFGFRLVSACCNKKHNDSLPVLFTETKQLRQDWIDKIQFALDRLAAVHVPRRCPYDFDKENELIMTQSKRDDGSVLDKWLHRLNLVCEEKDKCCHYCDISPSKNPSLYSSSSSSTCSRITPIALENRSLESLLQVGYFSEDTDQPQPNQRHYKDISSDEHQSNKNMEEKKKSARPIKSLLKQRALYAANIQNNHDSNVKEIFDFKPIIPLSPRPSPSSFLLK